jgi:hypothetical protein
MAHRWGSMAPMGEKWRRTWRGCSAGEVMARAPTRVGEGRGKGIHGRWADSACWPLDGLG